MSKIKFLLNLCLLFFQSSPVISDFFHSFLRFSFLLLLVFCGVCLNRISIFYIELLVHRSNSLLKRHLSIQFPETLIKIMINCFEFNYGKPDLEIM